MVWRLTCSTKTSSFFNSIVTVVHLVFILLIIGLGFAKGRLSNLSTPGDAANASGFAPYGARGIFNAAAIVFFSYIGYDAVSTMAEEVQNPSKNMPRGIVGSVIIVTVLYCLLAASISFLVPYDLVSCWPPDPQTCLMALMTARLRHVRGRCTSS